MAEKTNKPTFPSDTDGLLRLALQLRVELVMHHATKTLLKKTLTLKKLVLTLRAFGLKCATSVFTTARLALIFSLVRKLEKKNSSIGWESESLVGTERLARISIPLLVLGFPILMMQSSCTSPGPAQKSTPQQLETSEDDYEDDESESGSTTTAYSRQGKFPLPKAATSWDTRALLMTAAQPPPSQIAACQDMVTAISNDATNQDDLARAQKPMTEAVTKDPEGYHWCFFNLMLKLDSQMEQGGPLIEQQAPLFFDGMRQLWVLSRGLDFVLGGNTYFSYLRARYKASSREYFGRNLETMGPPLKVRPLSSPGQPPQGAKPAGVAPVNLPDDAVETE